LGHEEAVLRFVVVSVHDISPSRMEATKGLLAELDRMGAVPRVLKVVPFDPRSRREDWSRMSALLRVEVASAFALGNQA